MSELMNENMNGNVNGNMNEPMSGNINESNNVNVNPDLNFDKQEPVAIVKAARKLFSNMGFRLLAGTVATYGICLAAQFAIAGILLSYDSDLAARILGNTTWQLLISIIPQYLIAMPVLAFIIAFKMPHKAPEKRKVGFGWFLLFFMMSYSIIYVSNIVATIINSIISSMAGASISTYEVQSIIMDGNIYVVSFFTVICAPIIEELIFRKLIIDRCEYYGEAASALVSGLAFGIFHGNLSQAIYAFCLGYFFALIYNKTGKVYITIFIHMIVNFMGSFVAVNLMKLVDIDKLLAMDSNDINAMMAYVEENLGGLMIFGLYGMLVMGIIVAGIILLIVNRRKLIPNKAKNRLPKGTTFKTVMGNPGMIIFTVAGLAYIAYKFIEGLVMM